jgi:hypothetical protein
MYRRLPGDAGEEYDKEGAARRSFLLRIILKHIPSHASIYLARTKVCIYGDVEKPGDEISQSWSCQKHECREDFVHVAAEPDGRYPHMLQCMTFALSWSMLMLLPV